MAFDRIWRDKIRKTVILDSSAILSFFDFSLDWEAELGRLIQGYHLVVPTAVIKELQVLAQRDDLKKKAAAALRLVAKYETIPDDSLSADQACVNIALRTKGIVVTNDAMLRKNLRRQGIAVVFLRGKKRLAVDE